MTMRHALVVLALLALPACLDPLVGTECASGYASCRGTCVAVGSCVAVDAGLAPDVDKNRSDAEAFVEDATALDANDDARAVDSESASEAGPQPVDGQTGETSIQGDTRESRDKAIIGSDDAQEDAPQGNDDVPEPIVVLDAPTIDEGTGDGTDACPTCLDGGVPVVLDGSAEEAGEPADGGTVPDGGENDADNSGYDANVPPDAPLVCVDPQVACNGQCVDSTADPENCGYCNTICSSGVCNNGVCLSCASDESPCGLLCVNMATDPDNCGACGVPCASGLCSNGQCEASGTGRAIAIGHDYLKNRPAMNRILGNAVFLWPINPVRLAVYEGAANPLAIAGADAAIAQVAMATGRTANRTVVAAADVPAQLANTDVFLVYSQENASDATLDQLGQDWATALAAFVQAGGTLVVLDGAYPGNSGTCRILSQSGLFLIAHNASATGDVCSVVARGDALTTGLPKTYLCEKNSVSFTTTDPAVAVTPVIDDGEDPVVIHKIF
jgi:hypothetical protein